jgi:hypothetical protein
MVNHGKPQNITHCQRGHLATHSTVVELELLADKLLQPAAVIFFTQKHRTCMTKVQWELKMVLVSNVSICFPPQMVISPLKW